MIRALFLLCLAWLPFDKALAIDVGFMTITPYYVGIVVLSCLTVMQIVLDRERFRLTATDVALVIVCVMYLCSTLLSDLPRTAGLLAFNGIFIPTLTYFVSKTLLQDEAVLLRALAAFGVGVAILAFVALIQFVAFPERPKPFGQDGVSMSTLAVLPLMVGLYGMPPRRKLVRAILVLGGVLAIGVSISRAYWIFVVISPALFWFFMRGRALLVSSAILFLSLVITLMVTLDKSFVAPVSINYREDKGIQRVLDPDHWKAAIYNRAVLMYEPSMDSIKQHPIFGRGLYIAKYQQTTTHNLHLEWLESGGLLGYLAFLALYLAHFRYLSRRGRGDALACAIGVASLGILMNGVTNGIMHSVMPTCAMLCLGLTAARLQGPRRKQVEEGLGYMVWQPETHRSRASGL